MSTPRSTRWKKEMRTEPACWALIDTRTGVAHSLHFFERECTDAVIRNNREQDHDDLLSHRAGVVLGEAEAERRGIAIGLEASAAALDESEWPSAAARIRALSVDRIYAQEWEASS